MIRMARLLFTWMVACSTGLAELGIAGTRFQANGPLGLGVDTTRKAQVERKAGAQTLADGPCEV